MLLQNLFERINERSPIFVLTPWTRNIGNCADDMHDGLVKARREGRRIVFLHERWLPNRLRARVANRELFAVHSPDVVSNRGAGWGALSWFLTALAGPSRTLYLLGRRCGRMLRRLLPAISQRPFRVSSTLPTWGWRALWKPLGVSEFSWAIVDQYEWKRQHREPLGVYLASARRQSAEEFLRAMGVPVGEWFVCLHVREAGFRNDATHGDSRNASIENYVKAIRSIVDAGGWVVRLGDPSMRLLPEIERTIDYAHSPLKSELMDVYLVSACRFYFGTNSGPLGLTRLFQKPTVLVNLSEWSTAMPTQHGDLAIIKHVFSRSGGRFLSVQEILAENGRCQSFGIPDNDYLLVENTPDEIRDLIEEYLRRREDRPYSVLQEAFNAARRRHTRQWLETAVLCPEDPEGDVMEKYRIASWSEGTEGTLGHGYLEQNWLNDSLDVPLPAPFVGSNTGRTGL